MKLLSRRADFEVGQHVELKGFGMVGYSGTIVQAGRALYRVRLDEGQSRLGHTILTVNKHNMKKDTE